MTEEEKQRIIDELELQKAYGYKFNNPQIRMITGCALKLIRYQDTEINKLNNVIDRMSKYIRACDIDENICKTSNCRDEEKCEDCIKEYFLKDNEVE